MAKIRYVGVDYSTKNMAMACIEKDTEADTDELVYVGFRKLPGTTSGYQHLIVAANESAGEMFEEMFYDPDVEETNVWVEKVFVGPNRSVAEKFAHVSGAVLYWADEYGYKADLVQNKKWKVVVGGNPTKSDTQAWVMKNRHDLPEDMNEHMYDATAIAEWACRNGMRIK